MARRLDVTTASNRRTFNGNLVWGTENNYRGINQGSREDGGAHTLVFGVKILVQQLPGAMP